MADGTCDCLSLDDAALAVVYPAAKCPASEARDTSRQPLTRASEAGGHWQLCDSSAAFRFEVPNRVCCRWCRNFKSAALATIDGIFSGGDCRGHGRDEMTRTIGRRGGQAMNKPAPPT